MRKAANLYTILSEHAPLKSYYVLGCASAREFAGRCLVLDTFVDGAILYYGSTLLDHIATFLFK